MLTVAAIACAMATMPAYLHEKKAADLSEGYKHNIDAYTL